MKEGNGYRLRAVEAATIAGVIVVAAGWVGLELLVGFREAELDRVREERDEWRKAGRQVAALEVLEQELSEIERIALLRADPDGPVAAAAEVARATPGGLRIDGLDVRAGLIVVRGWTAGLDALADWLEKMNRSQQLAEPDLRQLASRPEFSGAPSARRGHSFTVLVTPISAPAGSAAALSGEEWAVDAAREPRPDPGTSEVPLWIPSTPLTHVPVKDLEVLEIHLTSSGAVARARGRGTTSWIRAGDLLQDGEVDWIGFFSQRLAAVRLKRWVWPPDGGRPYREELRVLGWESLAEPGTREEGTPVPGTLRVAGREALGSWPEGRYSNLREALVGPAGRDGLPRVDLFAAVFHELRGLFPWQHESWRQGSWTVETGFPWRGSIRGLEEPGAPVGTRRDPFRPPFEPWASRQPVAAPTWRSGGLAGLLIDEIELEEIYATARGPVAEARSHGSFRPWTLRPGDHLADGEVVSVALLEGGGGSGSRDCGEVVLRQVVDDPMALKPFREVVKRLGRHGPRPCPRGSGEDAGASISGPGREARSRVDRLEPEFDPDDLVAVLLSRRTRGRSGLRGGGQRLEGPHPQVPAEVGEEGGDRRLRAADGESGGPDLGKRAFDGGSRAQQPGLEAVLRAEGSDPVGESGSGRRFPREEEALAQAVDSRAEIRQPRRAGARFVGLPAQVNELTPEDLGARKVVPEERDTPRRDEAAEHEQAGGQSAKVSLANPHDDYSNRHIGHLRGTE